MKFLTFGEIMLRLKAPGQECFFQSPMLEATFGGGEANVAVSLANYGEDAAFLTVLPDNAIADACKAELRRFDVDTKRIVTGEGRMGIYYLEGGANQRPSKVVYDRAWSAIQARRYRLGQGVRRRGVVPHHRHHARHQRERDGAFRRVRQGGEETRHHRLL